MYTVVNYYIYGCNVKCIPILGSFKHFQEKGVEFRAWARNTMLAMNRKVV
jgi:hypothetical protein